MRKNLNFNYISATEKILDDAFNGKEFAIKYFEENKEKFKNWALYPFTQVPFDCDSVIEEVTRRYAKILNTDVAYECFKAGIKNE